MLATSYSDGKSYSPIENIISRREIESISNHLASIMILNYRYMDNDDLYDLKDYLRYLFTEIMNNVIDHSGSPVGGYAMAQYYPTKNKIQFAVADRGVGFLHNVKLKKSNITTEEEAIMLALQKGFTATPAKMYGYERNAGFGLYAMKEILDQTGGTFVIISNDTMLRYSKGRSIFKKLTTFYKGVIVGFDFFADKINLKLGEFQKGYLWLQDSDEEELY